MTSPRDPSERIFSLSDENLQEIRESIHSELTTNETKKLLAKVGRIVKQRGITVNMDLEHLLDEKPPDK